MKSSCRLLKLALVIVATANLLSIRPAMAQDVKLCHGIKRWTERLECYDKATGYTSERITDSVSMKVESGPSGHQWVREDKASSLDGRRDVWLSVPSTNTQPNQIGNAETARLWVRCMQNTTNAFITFNDYTPDNQTVRYKLDDDPVQTIWMVHMQGGKGVGLWTGGKAIPFVRKMFDRETMVVGYKSFNNQNLEFRFDISGLRKHIDPLASSCNWTP